ncbi:hypothetical protein ACMD2_03950, partial [Ananas comosus]
MKRRISMKATDEGYIMVSRPFRTQFQYKSGTVALLPLSSSLIPPRRRLRNLRSRSANDSETYEAEALFQYKSGTVALLPLSSFLLPPRRRLRKLRSRSANETLSWELCKKLMGLNM